MGPGGVGADGDQVRTRRRKEEGGADGRNAPTLAWMLGKYCTLKFLCFFFEHITITTTLPIPFDALSWGLTTLLHTPAKPLWPTSDSPRRRSETTQRAGPGGHVTAVWSRAGRDHFPFGRPIFTFPPSRDG